MSRTDEVNKMTENVYKGILDQFNPSLKNFVTMGKHYEKALTGVTVAAKGYFDALVKLGELASDSQGSKELGDTLFQMAEVHRQIQVQLEDVLKLFHSELLAQLEQKLELDIKYLTATLKKYQSERRSKSESIERCQSQLKKLRRKSQGSRHPNKYGDREMQFVELMSRRQGELDTLVAAGYKSALTEERRRYCFLVDRQCCVTKLLINYHSKVRELLSQKLSSWQQSCSQPTKLPERALNLLRHTAPQSSGAAGIAEVLRHTKLGSAQPEQRLSVQEVPPLLNGDSSRSQQQQQQQQQQQRSVPSSSQSDTCPPQGSPQTFRSASSVGGAAAGGSSRASPQHTTLSASASPLPDSSASGSGSASPATSTPTTSGGSAQQSSLLLAANTSNLSPSLIPSTVMSLSQLSPPGSSLQGMTLPIPHSAPHSPPLPHSAPLSRAMTPVQLLHQQVGPGGSNTLSPSHNPWLLKTTEMCATATLPLPRRPVSEMRLGGFQGSSLPRMLPLSGPTRVEAMFPHTPGASEGGGSGGGGGGACLLHFLPGDNITLLISEPRDGWHYGQNERTGRKGWFPFSYTQPQHSKMDPLGSSLFLSKANSTSTGQLDKLGSPGLPALTPESEEERSLPPQRVSTFRPRPYSMADSNKITSDLASPPPSPTRPNPFAHVRLRKTVTNDRSAPIIE
ncbi:brain-specific angiogenesis inhibitor 1-associated protein 2 isoform X2 [Mugil cephalus]|uniref:brain-specific angiogenesis inhibitor 1-associated protein 2 isoform X2 n=1 Tax=Mugil cephalus TaxID=48193 RepID=UPI001FB753A1|nr:brain-specific angiogenesis inhibitor 1-associated protein 2 isoform X2 [Mugil cephalus]